MSYTMDNQWQTTEQEIRILRTARSVFTFYPLPIDKKTCDDLDRKGMLYFSKRSNTYEITGKGMDVLSHSSKPDER